MLACIKMRGILRKVCELPCACGVASVLGWKEVITNAAALRSGRVLPLWVVHTLSISPPFSGIPRLRRLRSE